MSSIKWKEAPNLICEISLNPGSMGQTIFTIIDDEGNEFEIGAPEFSFNVAMTSGANVSRSGDKITRVGRTSVGWNGSEPTWIGNICICWSSGHITKIGRTTIAWNRSQINWIGSIYINWSSDRISRVGRAGVSPDGSVSGTVK